jgi:hypothetical protein
MLFIALDEYHELFSTLPKNEQTHMAALTKSVFLAEDTPAHFCFAGSTQAVFWGAVGLAACNGVSFLREAHIITTPFDETEETMTDCKDALVVLGEATEDDVSHAADLLMFGQCNPVNMMQVTPNRHNRTHRSGPRSQQTEAQGETVLCNRCSL